MLSPNYQSKPIIAGAKGDGGEGAVTTGDIMAYAMDLAFGIQCTCCGETARQQCKDHDDGFGVCDACLKKYGRAEFCNYPDCTAHD